MRYFSLLLTIGLACSCAAQYPGALDTTYRPWDQGLGQGDGTDRRVQSCVRRPDGRMLVGGQFSTFNAIWQQYMLGSLNTDGTTDTSFVPTHLAGSVSPRTANALALQPDGMLLVGGNMNGGVHRMQQNGEVDSTFITGAGFAAAPYHDVFALALQPDGKIIVGGRFTSFNGMPLVNLARLNANGTLDATFSTASGLNDDVLDLVLQPDGKIVVVGRFTNCWGPAGHMVRLNANGTLDPTFQSSPGADYNIHDVLLRADGTLVMVGGFYNVNGTATAFMCRLTSNGVVDPGFVPAAGVANFTVSHVAQQADQRLLVSSNYSLARLMPDGSLDPTFQSPLLTYQPTYTRAIDQCLEWPDGRIFIVGAFVSVNGRSANHFALLNADGSIDDTFGVPYGFNHQVDCISRLADGSVVVSGVFNGVDGVSTNSWYTIFSWNTVRLTADGVLDTAFTPYGDVSIPNAQALQPDGKILTGGFRLVRLHPDGSLDTDFPNGPLAGNNLIQDIAVQPDGKILLTGNLQGFAGVSSPGIVRLNDDGTVDGSFVVGTGFPYPEGATRMALQPDGRIIVTGPLITYNDTAVGRLCRLMPNGAIDTSFHTGTGFNGETADVELLPDGRMLVSGYFASYNGYASEGLVLLMPNGDVDSSFVSEPDQSVTNGWPVLKYDPIGKILFGINYSEAGLLRLNLDGSIDPTFDTGTTLTGLTDLVVQPDSTYLICGSFTSYNGVGRNRIARIQGGHSDKTTVQVKVFLGGPYIGGSMNYWPYIQGTLPLTEPYSSLGYAHVGSGGGESITGFPYPQIITDWVVVELRDATDPTIVVATQSALLQRTGQVLSTAILKNLVFDVPHGSYYVAVHHRNHLGVMTASALPLDDMPTLVDFTLPSTPTYGTDAQKLVGSRTVLWSGDANNNGTLKYTGAANDRDAILVAIGGINPLNTVNGYLCEDVNLDGTVKYTGAINDRDPILVNIGAIVTGIRLEQVP